MKRDLSLALKLKGLKNDYPTLPTRYLSETITQKSSVASGLFSVREIANEEGYLTARDLAGMLGMARVTVYSWVRRGRIPFFKFEGLVRFDPKEIEDWIKERYCCRGITSPAPPTPPAPPSPGA